MSQKCPGQDSRNIRVETIVCSACGYEIEIFSDELKAKCLRCKRLVCRKLLPSCVAWCKAAKDCVGIEKWEQLKGG